MPQIADKIADVFSVSTFRMKIGLWPCRFDAAIKVLNSVTSPKLPILLQQIASRTAEVSDPDGDGDAGRFFTPEQEAKLLGMLGLDTEALNTVMRAAAYIFETAGFAGAKPAILADELVGAGMDADRATAFHDAWAAEGAAAIASMRGRTLGGPAELIGSAFQVHQAVGTPGLTLLRDASAIVELHVKGMASRPAMDVEGAGGDATAASSAAAAAAAAAAEMGADCETDAGVGVRGAGDERVRLELSQAGLLALLGQLDDVQRALDRLNG